MDIKGLGSTDGNTSSEQSFTQLVGGRYRIDATLGKGGMAVVYRAWDAVEGRDVALKRATRPASAETWNTIVAFFEREFFTLTHLRHPRIVSVYDYGLDDDGPYYTMELLDGGDLVETAPIDWRRACAIAYDVCSALALLHSRRMVHRDLSPRNVRCTNDGLAKLIDFGAMSPMGLATELIGTWPCCAPEMLSLLPLDARTDLYSLGATLYFMLVGRHAHPARSLPELLDMWRREPRGPSAVVQDIPEALDKLVMSLMEQEPAARPANAAEVLDRLGAIAGLPNTEQLLVPEAYLSTPTLVGRGDELASLRASVAELSRGRGASVLVRGASGTGRSRILDACLIEAKLDGAIALRANGADTTGDYGVVRTLASQLIRLLPEIAYDAAEPLLATLGGVIPELLEQAHGVVPSSYADAQDAGRRIQPALRQWFTAVGQHHPLIIAVDDVHRIDEPSFAFLSLFATEISRMPIILASTVDARAKLFAHQSSVLAVLAAASKVLTLEPLSVEGTGQLLGSVFGEQPNLVPLTHRLYGVAGGNPRDLMRLSQHLVDKGVLRYARGSWILPEAIEAMNLPSSMAQALLERVRALDGDAIGLARTLAFAPDERFSYEECLALAGH